LNRSRDHAFPAGIVPGHEPPRQAINKDAQTGDDTAKKRTVEISGQFLKNFLVSGLNFL